MSILSWNGTGLAGSLTYSSLHFVGLAGGRDRRRQPAAGLEVERLRLGRLRRPGVVLAPLVGAGLEDPGLGVLVLALALEVVLEERQLDVLAVELGRLGVEADVAERARRRRRSSRRATTGP